MNQQCKVCGEPAAGFHFGAFTCEGCKSFFGRTYNNLSSISECKNNGECVINKKNRTACKACRLRKCLLVGMSKSGSRYGRRSNWFKIHCLLQEQQQKNTSNNSTTSPGLLTNSFMPTHFLTNICGTKHQDTRRTTSSPSDDSGASSADLEDNSIKDGSIESSLESKTEKSSISSYKTEIFRPGLEQMSSYLPTTQYHNLHNNHHNHNNNNHHNHHNINNNNNNNNHHHNNNNHHLNNNNNNNHHHHINIVHHNHHIVPQMTSIIIPSVVRLPTITIEEQDEPIDLSVKTQQKQIITRIPSPVIHIDNTSVKPVPLDLTLVRPKSLSG